MAAEKMKDRERGEEREREREEDQAHFSYMYMCTYTCMYMSYKESTCTYIVCMQNRKEQLY